MTRERPDAGQVVVRGGPTGYTNTIRTQRHEWTADEPTPIGEDRGPNPYELLLSALGACTSMTLRMYADRKGWPLTGVETRLSHDRIHAEDCADCETQQGRIDRIRKTLVLEGDLTDEQRARLAEIADRCPVHRTLEGSLRIDTVNWR